MEKGWRSLSGMQDAASYVFTGIALRPRLRLLVAQRYGNPVSCLEALTIRWNDDAAIGS